MQREIDNNVLDVLLIVDIISSVVSTIIFFLCNVVGLTKKKLVNFKPNVFLCPVKLSYNRKNNSNTGTKLRLSLQKITTAINNKLLRQVRAEEHITFHATNNESGQVLIIDFNSNLIDDWMIMNGFFVV